MLTQMADGVGWKDETLLISGGEGETWARVWMVVPLAKPLAENEGCWDIWFTIRGRQLWHRNQGTVACSSQL